MTLAQLAAETDLDKGYLSRIERGQKSPSISTLLKIAEALEVQVGLLFGETTAEDAIFVVRGDQHVDMTPDDASGMGLLQAILPASNRRRLSLFVIEPGQATSGPLADHPGDETVYVLSGSLQIEFPDRSVDLHAGDCVHFDGHLRHDIRQLGESRARALVMIAQDLPSRAEG
jgi:mannose-6-phosphate isomerase-like protein (cupin superfamily)/DNA-binding XRE family transcriptional regulator